MANGGSVDRSLEYTPTWAVAFVCTVMVIISVMMEHGIHKLGKVDGVDIRISFCWHVWKVLSCEITFVCVMTVVSDAS